MKNEQMLKLRYETDMPAGNQIDCYLSCNIRINKGELKNPLKHSPSRKSDLIRVGPISVPVGCGVGEENH